jgi:hypothetical protein
MVTRSLSAARSMSISDTPAWLRRLFSCFLSFRSSCRVSAYFASPYQRECQVLL